MSNLSFTKLFSSITDSSVWQESDQTRLVWITMLSMADPVGRIHAAIPGLSHRARVPLKATEEALELFLSPDPYSRSEENDGRRIEKIQGGWRLLNYKAYRELQDDEIRREQNRIAQERKRIKDKKLVSKLDDSQQTSAEKMTVINHADNQHPSAQVEVEVEADVEVSKSTKTECLALVERAFVSYCTVFKKNPKLYTLTPERKKKALLRLEERLAIHEGDMDSVAVEFKRAIANLAASEFHRTKGYLDWTEQIFRSTEEFEKRINWQKLQGETNGTFNRNHGKTSGNIDSAVSAFALIDQRDREVADEVRGAEAGTDDAGYSLDLCGRSGELSSDGHRSGPTLDLVAPSR